MGFKVYQEYYYFLKDVQGNVRSVVRAHQNIAQAGFVVDEVARYEYDAWGNATSSNFNNAKIDGVDVAEFNPIRWKSQYYDTESGLYYINGRYYSPETKRYVDSGNPETALANAATIYGLNLQNSTLTNPVNELYNEYTIETQTALTYAPPELNKWQAFWNKAIKWFNNLHWGWKIGIGLLIIAALAIATVATAGATGVGIGAAFASGFTGAALVSATGASVTAVALCSAAFAGATVTGIIGFFAGGLTFSNGQGGWSWDGAALGLLWGVVTGGIAGTSSSVIGNIGNGLNSGMFRFVQSGLNSILSGGITATQGIISGDFSWTSVGVSMLFGAFGGLLGDGLKNFAIGIGLNIAESSIGELIEWLLSRDKSNVVGILHYRYSY